MLAGETPGPDLTYPYDTPTNGRLWLSVNYGVDWNEVRPNGNDKAYSWQSVACDSDGSFLIACIKDLSVGRIYISSDSGVNWSETRPSGDNSYTWQGVDCNEDGSIRYAIQSNGRVYKYSDGSWAEIYPYGDYGYYWNGITCDSTGDIVVAYAWWNYSGIFLSIDGGNTWKLSGKVGSHNWYDVDIDNDGNFVMCSYSGSVPSGRVYKETLGPVEGYGQHCWTDIAIGGAWKFVSRVEVAIGGVWKDVPLN
jgi:hypothetical protein